MFCAIFGDVSYFIPPLSFRKQRNLFPRRKNLIPTPHVAPFSTTLMPPTTVCLYLCPFILAIEISCRTRALVGTWQNDIQGLFNVGQMTNSSNSPLFAFLEEINPLTFRGSAASAATPIEQTKKGIAMKRKRRLSLSSDVPVTAYFQNCSSAW